MQSLAASRQPQAGEPHSQPAAKQLVAKPAAAGGKAGVKRTGTPEAGVQGSAKRPALHATARPLPQQPQRAASPGSLRRPSSQPVSGPQHAAPPAGGAGSQARRPPHATGSRLVPAGAGTKPRAAGASGGGSGGRSGGGGRALMSEAAAAGQPVGGFGAGQWHGFREGQVVWAKMAGFPAWPAQVLESAARLPQHTLHRFQRLASDCRTNRQQSVGRLTIQAIRLC